jgi:hypothetical protein
MGDLVTPEMLRKAAAKLRKVAGAATPGPWERPLDVRYKAVVTAALPEGETGRWKSGNTPDGQRERVGVVQLNIWSDGKHMRPRGGRDLEWIALANPLLAGPLERLLLTTAAEAERHEAKGWGNSADEMIPAPVADLALLILGEAVATDG